MLFTTVGLVAAMVLSYMLFESFMYVSTDDASVEAHALLLSSQIHGVITRADVQENEKVKAGQVLVEISPDDYQNALAQRDAQAGSFAAQLKSAQANYERIQSLYAKNAVSKERLDSAEAEFKSLQAQYVGASADATEAKLNLHYTQILAPSDGTVGRKSFDVGSYASPGQPLFGFVSNDERWVTANLKETDLANLKIGQTAFVEVDAVPGHEFEGQVDSISPATGATFTLLPPDNATGNFTKVVQRVPVKIKLLNLSPDDIDRLAAGLSAEVKIKVH
jgi:membrane fusion protein (multidrug efflux system)